MVGTDLEKAGSEIASIVSGNHSSIVSSTKVIYENTSYGGRKRCKGCTVLNRLREER